MPLNLKQLVAAGVLALAGPAAMAVGCPDSPHWRHLGPPAFTGADDCNLATGTAPAPREFDLSVDGVSFYAGTRFVTSDAAPAPFSYRQGAMRRTDRGLAPAPTSPLAGLAEWADAPPMSDALALLLVGFLGLGLAVRRRGRL